MLYTMNADGSSVTRVGGGVVGESPVWSPDATEFAYARDAHLHVVSVTGSGDRIAYAGSIEWGPTDWAREIPLPAGPPCIAWGTASADRINGTRFGDVIEARAGNDRIRAGAGDDQIAGGFGADTIDAGSGNDWVDGGPGDDVIRDGAGNDHVFGGPGNDTIYTKDGQRDVVSCGPGRDTVYADKLDSVAKDCERVLRAGS